MIKHLIKVLWGYKLSNILLFLLLTATTIVMIQSVSGTLDRVWYYNDSRGYSIDDVSELSVQSKVVDRKKDSINSLKLFKQLRLSPYLANASFGSMNVIYEGTDMNNMVGYKGKNFNAYYRFSDEYTADVMGISLLSGRWFTESDANQNVVVISKEAAMKLFDATEVVNQTFTYKEKTFKVIGVTNSIRQSKRMKASASIFLYNKRESGFLIKTKPNQEEAFRHSMESIIQSVYGANQYIISYETLNSAEKIMNETNSFRLRSFLQTKLFMILVAAFSLISVLWYTIDKRKNELAMRFVLGRTLPQLIRQVLCENYFLLFSSFLFGLLIIFNLERSRIEILSNNHTLVAICVSLLFMFFLDTLGALIPCMKIKTLPITEIIKNE